MMELRGKISDRIRGELKGKVVINPGRPDMEKVKTDTPHDKGFTSKPNRRRGDK